MHLLGCSGNRLGLHLQIIVARASCSECESEFTQVLKHGARRRGSRAVKHQSAPVTISASRTLISPLSTPAISVASAAPQSVFSQLYHSHDYSYPYTLFCLSSLQLGQTTLNSVHTHTPRLQSCPPSQALQQSNYPSIMPNCPTLLCCVSQCQPTRFGQLIQRTLSTTRPRNWAQTRTRRLACMLLHLL